MNTMSARSIRSSRMPVKSNRQTLPYRPSRHIVKRHGPVFPSRPNRRPPQAPATTHRPAGSQDGTALSLLLALLALQGGMLSSQQRARTHQYIRRWVREIVETRHATEAAA